VGVIVADGTVDVDIGSAEDVAAGAQVVRNTDISNMRNMRFIFTLESKRRPHKAAFEP
jgi:hypothetical protein